MTTVGDILAHKASGVLTIGPQASTLDATLLMNRHNVGCLVVTQRTQIVGIFTERDILRRVVGQRRAPATVSVREVMSRDVCCAKADMPLDTARAIMKNRRIRHLPVVNRTKRPVGMISIGDINAWDMEHLETENHYLHEYVHQVA